MRVQVVVLISGVLGPVPAQGLLQRPVQVQVMGLCSVSGYNGSSEFPAEATVGAVIILHSGMQDPVPSLHPLQDLELVNVIFSLMSMEGFVSDQSLLQDVLHMLALAPELQMDWVLVLAVALEWLLEVAG
uniref:Uncharacterized protein n=1 Tax=Molossus molossus TaxID=27622 RepID=A0A7J8DPR7_MOLMO|nr:hypothetical protein HJG59_009267 [Molossus molossus]